MFWYALLIVLVVIIIYVCAHHGTRRYVVEGMVVNVISDYANRGEAIKLVVQCNERMLRLLEHLRKKYKIGATDEECGGDCAAFTRGLLSAEKRLFIEHLLRDYNYEVIHENRPKPGSASNVAYSVNKGSTIMLCLRSNSDPHEIVDIDTLMFVVIHEAAHIANYAEWGHETQFWQIFKYLLQEAAAIGAYEPTDYAKTPKTYCGFFLNHNPYFDERIRPIINV